ncbi:MAG: single-stranded DNA-binding protein [Bdellovibrionaceae bacterium]|jgi:single-strand DNA-binding protein|nr:single-stranded DNA-binding protein [Pseudobdellovibrionaceae bacterium]
MAGVNKVIIVGRLGNNPELKTLSPGNMVATFSVATSESWVKDGQKQERTEWHRIVVWGKQAENCSKYLAKGRQVYIEGRLQTRQWEDQQGQKKFSTEIVANTVQFLGSNNEQSSYSNNNSNSNYSNNHSDDFQAQDFGPEPKFDTSEEIPF